MKIKYILLKNYAVTKHLYLLFLITLFCFGNAMAQGDVKKNRYYWPAGDTSKLLPLQVKFLLNECFNNTLISYPYTFGIGRGIYSLSYYIDNDVGRKNIYITFEYNENPDWLKLYERTRYIDYTHTQSISESVISLKPAFKIPVIYQTNGEQILNDTQYVNHAGHIQISNLYLHRDEISIFFKITMKSPSYDYCCDTGVFRLYAKRCDTGEILLYKMDFADTFGHGMYPHYILPHCGCPMTGPSTWNNNFVRSLFKH